MNKVTAVVVTYNHIEFLKKCLNKILNQTYEVTNIVIVDNASNDGTGRYINNLNNAKIDYIKLENNTGGAGGFNQGIKEAVKLSSDFTWIMDDDTMPEEDALSKLMDMANDLNFHFGYLSSNVRWTNNMPCLMNVPKPITVWNEKKGAVRVSQSTFVSMLIPTNIIKKVGLPIKEFFIWNDDTEYSLRISKEVPSYFVEDSYVIHDMKVNIGVDLVKEEDRIARYFYGYRNRFYIAKHYGWKKKLEYHGQFLLTLYRILFKKSTHKFSKVKIMYKGFISGLFFNPNVEKIEK